MLRGAERIWPTRNEAQPNGEGVASGSATHLLTIINSLLSTQCWSHRLTVRTADSHSANRGSIPLGTTINWLSSYSLSLPMELLSQSPLCSVKLVDKHGTLPFSYLVFSLLSWPLDSPQLCQLSCH